MAALKDTLHQYQHMIEEVGLAQKHFQMIGPKLNDVKYID